MSVSRHQAVGAYRRWEPQAFDADEQAAAMEAEAPPPPPEAPPEPEPPPEPPMPLPTAEDIENMFEQARGEGHATGFEEGRAAGFKEGQAEARKQANALAAVVGRLESAIAGIEQDVAEEIVALALEVARRTVGRTLADHPAVIADTVREALHALPQNQIRIHLHPDDAALVREYLGEQLVHGQHQIIENDRIGRGGCRLEAAGSELDATIETRWRRVLESIGRDGPAWQEED